MISEVIYFNLFHKSHVICSVATKHGVGTWCSVRLWNGIRLPNRLSIFHKPHMIWKKNKSKFDLGQPSIGSGIVISCLSRHKTMEQGAPHSRFFCSHIAVDDEHLWIKSKYRIYWILGTDLVKLPWRWLKSRIYCQFGDQGNLCHDLRK